MSKKTQQQLSIDCSFRRLSFWHSAFARGALPIAGERTIVSHGTMTGNCQRDDIRGEGPCQCANRLGCPDPQRSPRSSLWKVPIGPAQISVYVGPLSPDT